MQITREPPQRPDLPEDRHIRALVADLRTALAALPGHFASETRIEGIDATDLFGLNAILGSTIELQVVNSLNHLRHIWDPEKNWSGYRFIRSAQTFPDVRLISESDNGRNRTALGIELKGWYLLSKEGEPSFRYTVTPTACAPQDLLVAVPWHLKNILSGSPVIHRPYIEQARYVAEYRNWWWTNGRKTKDSEELRHIDPPGPIPGHYPGPGTRTADVPAKDGGNNFGRVACIGSLMDGYVESLRQHPVAGIPAVHWLKFFQLHAEARSKDDILDRLSKQLRQTGREVESAERITDAIMQIVEQFGT